MSQIPYRNRCQNDRSHAISGKDSRRYFLQRFIAPDYEPNMIINMIEPLKPGIKTIFVGDLPQLFTPRCTLSCKYACLLVSIITYF
jgi:hypothetical protein